jgi:hypothetical protein
MVNCFVYNIPSTRQRAFSLVLTGISQRPISNVRKIVYVIHHERLHQSLDNKFIDPPPDGKGAIVCKERLGGLLKFYKRAA